MHSSTRPAISTRNRPQRQRKNVPTTLKPTGMYYNFSNWLDKQPSLSIVQKIIQKKITFISRKGSDFFVHGTTPNGNVDGRASRAAHVMSAAIPNVLQPRAFVGFEKTEAPNEGATCAWMAADEAVSSTRGLLATDHVILNHGQGTWTTPELAPPLLTTTPHQREDVSALDRFNVHRCPTRRVFSGTGIELMTCLPWLDTLTTGLPQPPSLSREP
ncbi:uncharacterized protein TNCV_3862831 [Trichonephila clavipes]|uniref:Uncharacterized protein n=1 Tax=Trichonephila clavipes TaxID=2585209 RepID=A0A8X6VG02_TRICX|nr:uncharacterized protein TNCV_3862831 [Trichonephila clavipes]